MSDRNCDNWIPLFAIAQCAGAAWLERARVAALKLSKADISTSSGSELLADIREIFESGNHSKKISTSELIEALTSDAEAPWATYNFGKLITPRQLAKLLSAFGIRSKTVRTGYGTPKGYSEDQFIDAFSRYLPELPSQQDQCAPMEDFDDGLIY